MIAVVKTGGKQYKVSEGDVIQVEKCEADVETTEEWAVHHVIYHTQMRVSMKEMTLKFLTTKQGIY